MLQSKHAFLEANVEELTDILVGLEQRISAYKNRFQELEKKRRRLDDEIATIKKYLELAETLYRVEADKVKLASLSNQLITDDPKGVRHLPVMDVTDQSREILLGRSKYVGKSVPEAAYEILRESNRAMHAKELVQRLIEGGLQIKGKTPLTSIATSLKRDRRFRKVGPNTFEALEDMLIQAV
ncbi:MAG: winged helix-turn-helix domain-containing protein [Nitrospira sp.]|nr:winged helix-turn-helix domain-containing protein [Nitrospira sp.]MDH4329492.1 winged helix-turn-helix domain-containing protein [Nitrospira sp.]